MSGQEDFQRDLAVPSDIEVKAYVKASRWHGDSYREIQANISERFKRNVGTATLWDWTHEDPDEVARFNNHRLAQIVDNDLEIATKAGQMVRDRIESETDTFKLVGAWKTARDQVNTTVKLAEDHRHNNELLDALRLQLRGKSSAELRAILEPPTETAPPSTEALKERHHHAHPDDHALN
jgi:hypothetical protein